MKINLTNEQLTAILDESKTFRAVVAKVISDAELTPLQKLQNSILHREKIKDSYFDDFIKYKHRYNKINPFYYD